MAVIDDGKVDELLSRAGHDVETGLLPACQLALAHDGRLVVFETFGAAAATTRFPMFSTTKTVVASVVWQLLAEGALSLADRVADHIPEFGSNGKDVVTVEQVLVHSSGFPRAPLGPPAWFERSGRLAAFARWRLNWEPGTRFEYHPTSSHWVLAELIERLTGQDFREAVHGRVTAPLGLPRVLGITEDDQDDIAELAPCGEPPPAAELEALFGVPELPIDEVTEEGLLRFNDPAVRALGVPAAGGIATAATVALFFQGVLANDRGLWDPDVLADAVRIRNRFVDDLRGVPSNRGLGVQVAGDDGGAHLRGFGHTQSPRAFGHDGAGGQAAWGDPETGLSFCYLTNGLDRNVIREARRRIAVSSRAGACVTGRERIA
jgi:CubicO group peptidase (beta-lactamase class C family)